MPRIRITRDIVVIATPAATVSYVAGWEGLAPDAHIDQIVAAGAGERLSRRGDALADATAPDAAQ